MGPDPRHPRAVTEAIEPLRREKVIGSSLEARILYPDLETRPDRRSACRAAEIYIVSEVAPGDRATGSK